MGLWTLTHHTLTWAEGMACVPTAEKRDERGLGQRPQGCWETGARRTGDQMSSGDSGVPQPPGAAVLLSEEGRLLRDRIL